MSGRVEYLDVDDLVRCRPAAVGGSVRRGEVGADAEEADRAGEGEAGEGHGVA